MTTEIIDYQGATPIGVQENGEVFTIAPQDRAGILYVFGRTGQGKSVMIESLIVSDISNGRGGMLIDPYGDLTQEIQSYLPDEKVKNVVVFEAQAGTVEENIQKFQKEIDLSVMESDAHKFLLCTLDYRKLGTEVASAIGREIVKRFLKIVGGDSRTIGIDEAHNFIDEELVEIIVKGKENNTSCVLSDQMVKLYKASMSERLLKATNHVVCYFVDTDTANTLYQFHPELSVSALTTLEKFYFLAKFNAQTSTPIVVALKGILSKDLFKQLAQ